MGDFCDLLASRAYELLVDQLSEPGRQRLRLVLPRQRAQLARKLYRTAKPCMELRLAAWRAAVRALKTESPGADSSLEIMHDEDSMRRHFPVLALVLSRVSTQWRRNILELSQRLLRDEGQLSGAFFHGKALGSLTRADWNLSDPHAGGRSVVGLHFERGSLVYKPRSGESEYEWALLLRWLGSRGLEPAPRALKVIRKPGYCWMEFAHPAPCSSRAEARRYFRRLGGLICLTHLLAGADFHKDNLIAAGEYPLVVDTETLCHPMNESDAATGIVPGDLLKTGWLRTKGYHLGALDAKGQGRHRARLARSTLNYAEFLPELCAGFSETWNLLLQDWRARGVFLQRRRRLESRCWRQLVRSTRFYQAVQRGSLHPRLMASGVARSRYIRNACHSADIKAHVRASEAKALFWLDVPHFKRRCRPPGLPAREDLAETIAILAGSVKPRAGRSYQ